MSCLDAFLLFAGFMFVRLLLIKDLVLPVRGAELVWLRVGDCSPVKKSEAPSSLLSLPPAELDDRMSGPDRKSRSRLAVVEALAC